MKSGALILLSIFLLSTISAVEFQGKTDFQQGETFLARISGNFFEPISENDIIFLRGHTRISIVPFVEKIDNDFYIYGQLLNKQPGNYSLVIENAKILEFGQIIEKDLERNFTINENFSDFSIEPGFISTDGSFDVEVQNLKDSEIILSYKIVNESEISEEPEDGGFFDFGSLFGSESSGETGENEIKIKTGETKKINFDKNTFDSFAVQKILFSTENTNYEFPVFITSDKDERDENISGNKLRFEPSELNISLGLNSKINRTVYLFNLNSVDLENIELSFSDELKPYILLPAKNISKINENSSEKIEITFFSGSTEAMISGQIKAKTSDDFYDYISVSLDFIKNYQPVNQTGDSSTPSCFELNGTICKSNEKCENANTKVSKDGICCLSSCSVVSGSSYGKIIGWTIVIIAVGFVLWFYFFKYRKVRNPVDLLKVARRR
ncbi:hypothetical protein HYT25_03445 [Candidatus Pacearchaeota archaeon]|nr:hypothetical protein [Candidatus Pacearchaeota archaeon]